MSCQCVCQLGMPADLALNLRSHHLVDSRPERTALRVAASEKSVTLCDRRRARIRLRVRAGGALDFVRGRYALC